MTGQMLTLITIGIAIAFVQVRSGIVLSAVRLLGGVGVQQTVDVVCALARLLLLALVGAWLLDAGTAITVHGVVALAGLWVLQRWLAGQLGRGEAARDLPAQTDGQHREALLRQLRMQAPNAIYFAFSSQVALWLIGIFGNAQAVAEVGALGRLAGLFTLIGTVLVSLAHPYFARHHGARELRQGFIAVNLMFAGLLTALVSLATMFPAPLLWILGPGYAGLSAELIWMVAAGSLVSWAGAVYSLGCARGWVLPFGLSVSTGVGATIAAACWVDTASVIGSFQINTAIGAVGTLVSVAFMARRLYLHSQTEGALP